jgi:hypothetical protein
MATPLDRYVSVAEILVGLGFALRGVTNLSRTNQQLRGLGYATPQTLPEAIKAKRGAIIEKVTTHHPRTIDERVSHIQRLIREGSRSPVIKEKALAVLTKKCGARYCVPEKNYLAEITALFNAVKDPRSPVGLRYTRDHLDVDQFTSAEKLLKLRGGDCDDSAVLLGSLLMSVGYPVKLRVIQDTNSSSWSHIFIRTGIPPQRPTRWISLDTTVAKSTVGWEVPGSSEAELSGKPSGLVTRTRDFDV